LDFHINIKKKSFINPHDKTNIDVLKNINIKIKFQEFVCIVGPSGCGKTTLMNIIGGLIDTKDKKLNNEQPDLYTNGNFGYVFQTSRLLPWLTVKENIELVCDSSDEYSKRIEHLLSEFDLQEFKNYYPKSISGGMRRKVSLARALVKKPQILLMDEPFVSLDQPTAENLYNVLVNYWEKNQITIILITHNLKEAILLGDRIIFFSKRPASVVYDHKIKAKRSGLSIDNTQIQNEYNQLRKKFPSLLKGLI
tara:strand:- start:242 stop:994 length:753 start_codon:yes stop_codon:yes gene_type:complete